MHETTIQQESHQLRQQQQKQKGGIAYWRYDDAGPTVYHARTHYLSSIPSTHRIGLYPEFGGNKKEVDDRAFLEKLYGEYAANPDHVWPKKLHLFEYNPSIAKLPEYYHENELWRRVFRDPDGSSNSNSTIPLYVSVYRVNHRHNCYDGPTNERIFGGSWKAINNGEINQTDYIGVSLMDADLNVVLDTTVTLAPISYHTRNNGQLLGKYNDYRLFNLGEKLYLTTMQQIVPIELELVVDSGGSNPSNNKDFPNTIPKDYLEIPLAFRNNEPNGVTEEQAPVTGKQNPGRARGASLRVWVRKMSSCPLGSNQIKGKLPKRDNYSGAKNFLYFNRDPEKDTAKAMFYPRFNPNDVRDVDLNARCDQKTRHGDSPFPVGIQPIDSFETIDKLKYPGEYENLFMNDRGSACCVRVKKNQIHPTILETNSSTLSDDKGSSGDDLLVAMVHPKTKFPGKRLPPGVIKNTYFSRFIAFLPEPPYTIVARSGMFCLGYPSPDLDGRGDPGSHEGPLTFVKMGRMTFANETYGCPRIHFVMGMIDKVKQKKQNEPDSVILSYGVADCLSRFVEIRKSEIVRMLSADAYTGAVPRQKTG